MAAAGKVTPAMLEQIRDCNARGMSVRATARQVGVHPCTVSVHGRRMGLTWGEGRLEQIKPAVAARVETARVRAAEAADLAIDECVTVIRRMHEPYVETQFSPIKGQWFSFEHPAPPSRPLAELARASREMYSILDRHLTRESDREELETSRGILGHFSDMIALAAAEMEPGGGQVGGQVITGALVPLDSGE